MKGRRTGGLGQRRCWVKQELSHRRQSESGHEPDFPRSAEIERREKESSTEQHAAEAVVAILREGAGVERGGCGDMETSDLEQNQAGRHQHRMRQVRRKERGENESLDEGVEIIGQ